MDLKDHIRGIPDFPKPGILFYDISTLLREADAWQVAMGRMARAVRAYMPDLVAGVESRGFLVAAPLALKLGCGFIMIRKRGKLPGETVGLNYALEYGEDRVEIQADAVQPGPARGGGGRPAGDRRHDGRRHRAAAPGRRRGARGGGADRTQFPQRSVSVWTCRARRLFHTTSDGRLVSRHDLSKAPVRTVIRKATQFGEAALRGISSRDSVRSIDPATGRLPRITA